MTSNKSKIEILDVTIFPHDSLPLTQIISLISYATQRELKAASSYYIPTWGAVKSKAWGADYIHTTDSYFEIITRLKIDGEEKRLIGKFTPEWITDLASVPKFFRSFVDDNAPWILPACQMHDSFFVLKGAGCANFESVNRVFYEMCRYAIEQMYREESALVERQKKRKRWKRFVTRSRRRRRLIKAALAYVAVSTPTGRKRYNAKRAPWESAGCTIEMERV